jgi:hypothetical protein
MPEVHGGLQPTSARGRPRVDHCTPLARSHGDRGCCCDGCRTATLQRGCGTLDAESFGIPAMLACGSAEILAGRNASRWHESYLSPGIT